MNCFLLLPSSKCKILSYVKLTSLFGRTRPLWLVVQNISSNFKSKFWTYCNSLGRQVSIVMDGVLLYSLLKDLNIGSYQCDLRVRYISYGAYMGGFRSHVLWIYNSLWKHSIPVNFFHISWRNASCVNLDCVVRYLIWKLPLRCQHSNYLRHHHPHLRRDLQLTV